MLAIFNGNQQAFHDHNMNSLMAGANLIIPPIENVVEVSATSASSLLLEHNQRWQQKRGAVNPVAKTSPSVDVNAQLKAIDAQLESLR